jgi:hypothetical protein
VADRAVPLVSERRLKEMGVAAGWAAVDLSWAGELDGSSGRLRELPAHAEDQSFGIRF